MSNTIDLDFADGSYTFALPLERIDELQGKTGIGIGGLFARVIKGANRIGDDVVLAPATAEFYALDLIETIRQGLIGGAAGMVDGAEIKVTPALAQRLVNNYILNRPLAEAWSLAVSILGAVIVGYEPEGGKKKAPPQASQAGAEPTAG
jgi:hypothetical protein